MAELASLGRALTSLDSDSLNHMCIRHFQIKELACTSMAICFGICSGSVSAATIVSPSTSALTEGNTNSPLPFQGAPTESLRYQQVYNASEFSSLLSPAYVTQLIFRPDSIVSRAFSNTRTGYQVNLSTTSASADNLSAVFASNVGGDNTVVFSGTLALSSNWTGPSEGPKDFDIVLDLQTPFFYNPIAGNLLLDVRKVLGTGQSSGPRGVFDAQTASGDSISRVYVSTFDTNNAANAVSGTRDSGGVVTMFTFSNVPEPSGAVLVIVAIAGMALSRSRNPQCSMK